LSEIVDGGICVHKEVGCGFFEKIYRNALCIELKARGIAFELEKSVGVHYRGQPVGVQRIDLVVGGAAIVELKAIECLAKIHEQQVLSYMRATKIRAGLLMNFGGSTLRQGLKRFVI
jgi:GxxExxY protein